MPCGVIVIRELLNMNLQNLVSGVREMKIYFRYFITELFTVTLRILRCFLNKYIVRFCFNWFQLRQRFNSVGSPCLIETE
jgi:hypothetical protein